MHLKLHDTADLMKGCPLILLHNRIVLAIPDIQPSQAMSTSAWVRLIHVWYLKLPVYRIIAFTWSCVIELSALPMHVKAIRDQSCQYQIPVGGIILHPPLTPFLLPVPTCSSLASLTHLDFNLTVISWLASVSVIDPLKLSCVTVIGFISTGERLPVTNRWFSEVASFPSGGLN